MSAANLNGIDAANLGKQALTRFDGYANLPAELRIKIIHSFIANHRKRPRFQKLAPFAALHSEWRHELEPEEQLWGRLCLTPDDLPAYRSMLNQRRGDSLAKLVLWIPIDAKFVDPDQEGYGVLNEFETQSRVRELVVHSVSTVFECVDYAKSNGPQPPTKGVEFRTEITIPMKITLGDHSHILPSLDFDFSRVPSTNLIREFSQGHVEVPEHRYPGYRVGELTLLLNRSSLLSLFGRMPNLENAKVLLDTSNRVPVTTVAQFNNCPKLRTLSLLPIYAGLPGSTLSSWVGNWSLKIERLSLGNTMHIPEFIRGLSGLSHGTGTASWPNLEELQIRGWFHPVLGQDRRGDHLHDILGAIPSALVSMPRVRGITITLNCPARILGVIETTLRLRRDSSKLAISAREESSWERVETLRRWPRWRENPPRVLTNAAYLWDLVTEDKVRSAVADIQAAVEAQHGQELKVVLPEKDHDVEHESQ